MFNQQRRQTFATAKEAAETETKKILQVKKPTTFQEAAQVDSMVIAGVIIVGGCTYVAYGTTQETKKDYLIQVLNKLRSLGINKSNIDITLSKNSKIDQDRLINKYVLNKKIKVLGQYDIKYYTSMHDSFDEICKDAIELLRDVCL